jgi:hypothetical protein
VSRQRRTVPASRWQCKVSERSQNIILWWSLVFAIIFGYAFYSLLGMVPPPSATLSPADVAAFYAGNASRIKLGAVVASWTSGFMVPFTVVIALQLARLEEGKPVWSVLAFAGGILSSMFLVFPPILWGVAAYTPNRLPEVTAAIHEVAMLTLVTTEQFYIFLFITISVVGLRARPDPNTAFPRWLCWATLFITVFIEVGALAFLFKSGPFSWNGLFIFWLPFGLFFVWLFPTYYHLFGAIKRQAAAKAG